jgi:hypothetical protein
MQETAGLLHEKKDVRRNVTFGRTVLELLETVEELEDELSVRTDEGNGTAVDDVDDEFTHGDDATPTTLLARRLRRQTGQYEIILRLRDRIRAYQAAASSAPAEHPLIASIRRRIAELRRLLLLDISSALRQGKTMDNSSAVLEIMACFSLIHTKTERTRDTGNG